MSTILPSSINSSSSPTWPSTKLSAENRQVIEAASTNAESYGTRDFTEKENIALYASVKVDLMSDSERSKLMDTKVQKFVFQPVIDANKVLPDMYAQLKTVSNDIESTRPDINASAWDFKLKDGTFQVTGDQLSEKDKNWIENKLNGNQALLQAAQGFMKAAETYFETTPESISYTNFNQYLHKDTFHSFSGVKSQLEEKFSFKKFVGEFDSYIKFKFENNYKAGTDKNGYPMGGAGSIPFDIMEATSLVASGNGVAPPSRYVSLSDFFGKPAAPTVNSMYELNNAPRGVINELA